MVYLSRIVGQVVISANALCVDKVVGVDKVHDIVTSRIRAGVRVLADPQYEIALLHRVAAYLDLRVNIV